MLANPNNMEQFSDAIYSSVHSNMMGPSLFYHSI